MCRGLCGGQGDGCFLLSLPYPETEREQGEGNYVFSFSDSVPLYWELGGGVTKLYLSSGPFSFGHSTVWSFLNEGEQGREIVGNLVNTKEEENKDQFNLK